MDHKTLKLQSLTIKEAELALYRQGPNEMGLHPHLIFKLILKQITSPIFLLYSLFAIIAAALGSIPEAIIIFAIVFFSTVVDLLQGLKTLTLLKDVHNENPPKVKVVRSGKLITIPIREIVVNDLVLLKSGDLVPADAKILYARNLSADESLISGNTFPINKYPKRKQKGLKDENMLYYQTYITSGTCYCRIMTTGLNTKYGKLISFEPKKKYAGFEMKLQTLVRNFMFLGILFIMFLIFILLITDVKEFEVTLLIFMLSLVISMIPETLPVINSLALISGASKLSKKGLYIKDLHVFEDMADVDMICTDKTGTLTLNKLKLEDFDTPLVKSNFFKYLHQTSHSSLDSFDIAIHTFLENQGIRDLETDHDFDEQPFDPFTKISSRKFDNYELLKGAPEFVLSQFSFEHNLKLAMKVKARTLQGERVLSLVLKSKGESKYLGTLFFSDPIKGDVTATLTEIKDQEILIKIISGDNVNICKFVAREVGLISSDDEVIEAHKLQFESPKILKQQLEQYKVIARADPIQKFKIIEALQQEHKIAYLGDGINDTPSIKLANVGIVVEHSVDIAKQNADLILEDKHLRHLIDSIMESRKIFENTDQYLIHALSSNFNNFLTIAILLFSLSFFPILPIQLLIGNLLVDLVAIKFAFDPVARSAIKRPAHWDMSHTIKLVFGLGIINTLMDLVFFYIFKDLNPAHLQTLWFTVAFVTDLLLILSVRTKKLFLKNLPDPSFLVNIILAVLIIIMIALYGIPLLSITAIPFDLWPILIITPLIYFIFTELVKIFLVSKFKNN